MKKCHLVKETAKYMWNWAGTGDQPVIIVQINKMFISINQSDFNQFCNKWNDIYNFVEVENLYKQAEYSRNVQRTKSQIL